MGNIRQDLTSQLELRPHFEYGLGLPHPRACVLSFLDVKGSSKVGVDEGKEASLGKKEEK